MARKVPLPVKVSQDLLERVDRATDTMSARAGVRIDRTQFVEKALELLCGQEQDFVIRERHRLSQEARG